MQPVNPPQRMDNKKKHNNNTQTNNTSTNLQLLQYSVGNPNILGVCKLVRMVKLVKILKNKINLVPKYSRKYLQFRMKFKAKHQRFSNSNRNLIDNSKIRFSFENHLGHFYENTNICFYFLNFV